MVKSLRWRLQIWHAAILICVVLGFGAALYLQMRRATAGDIDAELLAGARVLEATLRTMPPPGSRSGPPPMQRRPQPGELGRPPGGERRPPGNESRPPIGEPGRPEILGRDFVQPHFGFDPSPNQRRRDEMLELPPSMTIRRRPGEELPYFIVFGIHGEILAGTSTDLVEVPVRPRTEFAFRTDGRYREVVLNGPQEQLIVVGRNVGPVFDSVNRFIVPIALSGLVVLGVGLVGGWWLAGRAIEPLQRISATASSITSRNLASRIDVSQMDLELAQLGSILNSMLQRLDTSFKQQARFVADASHELRTPISVLSMHCELALSRERKPDEYQKTLTTCLRASDRMRSLVEDLLMLAKADSGQLVMRNEAIDLSLIIDESVQLLVPLADRHQVTLHTKTSSVLCRGDSNHLLRLVSNLLSNAILYNKPQGTVSIELNQSDGATTLRITDTGCGIPSDEIPKLFDRFYRVDEARSRETGGSGLGLSICQSIAVAHSGRLEIKSQQDVGTTVGLTLPQEASPSK